MDKEKKDTGKADWKDNPTETERLDMIESFLASAGLDLAVPELNQIREGAEQDDLAEIAGGKYEQKN